MKKTMLLISAALATLAVSAAVAAARSQGPVAHSARLGSKIVLFKSIGGVKLGMTPKRVKRMLGKPSHTTRVSGKIAEFQYDKGFQDTINVDFDTLNKADLANGVFGFMKRMHTSKGIHPGSTVKQLKHAYGKSLHKFPGGYALYKGKPGAIGSATTQFTTEAGKVDMIDVQKVFNDLG